MATFAQVALFQSKISLADARRQETSYMSENLIVTRARQIGGEDLIWLPSQKIAFGNMATGADAQLGK